jgi:hypothetical protein
MKALNALRGAYGTLDTNGITLLLMKLWLSRKKITTFQGGISISQQRYCLETVKRFNFDHAKIRTTPLDPGVITTKEENDMTMEEPPFHYRSAIGCLTYLGLASRPDIVTAVNILAQFQERPDKRHFGAVAHLMGYFSGTNDLAIHSSGTKDHSLLSFSDSNWKSPISRSGYIMILSGGYGKHPNRKQ